MGRVVLRVPARRRIAWSGMAVLAVAAVLSLDAPALARHNFSMLRVSPELGAAGGEVSVSGFSYPVNTKVAIRFNAVDGPVLAELDPTANQDISGTVRIPAGTAAGRYVLYAVQYDAAGKPNRIPGRAAVTVGGRDGPPPAAAVGLELEARPGALIRADGAGAGQLALVGFGAFALAGLLGLVMVRVVTSRKGAAS